MEPSASGDEVMVKISGLGRQGGETGEEGVILSRKWPEEMEMRRQVVEGFHSPRGTCIGAREAAAAPKNWQ